MNLIPGRSWFQAWARRRLRSRGPDFGDMGTAFGLDASLDPAPAPAPAAKPARAAWRRRRWGAKRID